MKISQQRARQLRKRVNELEQQIYQLKKSWGKDYPDGTHILTLDKGDTNGVEDAAVIHTARALGHPVIVMEQGGALHFYGVKL